MHPVEGFALGLFIPLLETDHLDTSARFGQGLRGSARSWIRWIIRK
jgi:hypothetical protein